MSNALHMVAVILLALALALAGGSRAMLLAHGQGVESVEICADAGIEVIFLDADDFPGLDGMGNIAVPFQAVATRAHVDDSHLEILVFFLVGAGKSHHRVATLTDMVINGFHRHLGFGF